MTNCYFKLSAYTVLFMRLAFHKLVIKRIFTQGDVLLEVSTQHHRCAKFTIVFSQISLKFVKCFPMNKRV